MHSVAEKVTAFVTRESPRGTEILLFEHPTAGLQLPAGTVEADEPHADAAAREASEETGLVDLPAGRFLAAVTETLPDEHYLVATTTRVYARPDTTNHRFRLFWAALADLPPIITPQRWWLKILQQPQTPEVSTAIGGD